MLIQFITSLPAFALLHTLSTKYTYYIIESLNKSHSHSQWRHNTHTHTHTQPHTYIFTLVYLQFSLEIRFEMLNKAFMRLIFMFIPEYYLFFVWVHPRVIFETDSGVARQKGAQSSVKSLVKLYFGLVLISPLWFWEQVKGCRISQTKSCTTPKCSRKVFTFNRKPYMVILVRQLKWTVLLIHWLKYKIYINYLQHGI